MALKRLKFFDTLPKLSLPTTKAIDYWHPWVFNRVSTCGAVCGSSHVSVQPTFQLLYITTNEV